MNDAPDFSLPDQDGNSRTLRDFKGSWLVLYFYPKDETPGCTAEACMFRDGRDALRQADADVVGISADSVESHKKFVAGHSLNFTLLSDENLKTIKAYGAWGMKTPADGGPEVESILRKTFLITPEGKIAKEYPAVDPAQHAAEVLKDLTAFRQAI